MRRPQLLVGVNVGLITATLLLLLHIATRRITRSHLTRLSIYFDFVDALRTAEVLSLRLLLGLSLLFQIQTFVVVSHYGCEVLS